jgi:hypothetical protein
MQVERFAMEAMQEPRDDQDKVAELLSQVRSMITAGGCADRIDAERWLMIWLDTPNSAFGGVEPRRLLGQAYNESTIR